MKTKIFLVVLILTSVFSVASFAYAMTDQERQALITQLQQQIAQLMSQLGQLQSEQQGTSAEGSWCHTFNNNLGYANSGTDEVVSLHLALQKQGISYSPDNVSAYSTGTSQAVIQFQAKYGIFPQSGYVGPKTRSKLNQLYGCESQNNTTVSTCVSSWSCTAWSACSNSQQTRTCADSNNCGVETNKPALTQGCTISCTPNCANKICGADNGCGGKCQTGACVGGGTACTNGQCVCSSYTTVSWSCTAWSACSNSQQTRNCSLPIGNNCARASTAKPATTQSCTLSTTPNTTTPNTTPTSAVTIDLKVNGSDSLTRASSGGVIALTWTSANAVSCVASDGWSGTKETSGSETISGLTSYTIFTLKCSNSSGFNTDKVYVNAYLPLWSCQDWSACTNGQQTRICNDTNNTGLNTNKPATTQSCCVPNWQCTNWSSCELSQQTRTCTDINNCSTNAGKPALSQYCSNPGGNWGTCKNYNIPGVTFSCILGIAPYGVSGDFIISNEQYLTWVNTFGAQYTSQYLPLRDCGCSWMGDGTGTWYTKLGCDAARPYPICSCGTGPQCDPSKVPNKLKPGSFIDYCSTPSVPDIVQWSSRISKGESQDQALQNTINDNKINMMISYEKICVGTKKYYIGGDAHSPNWMSNGVKYRLVTPSAGGSYWQKWADGAWVSF